MSHHDKHLELRLVVLVRLDAIHGHALVLDPHDVVLVHFFFLFVGQLAVSFLIDLAKRDFLRLLPL